MEKLSRAFLKSSLKKVTNGEDGVTTFLPNAYWHNFAAVNQAGVERIIQSAGGLGDQASRLCPRRSGACRAKAVADGEKLQGTTCETVL